MTPGNYALQANPPNADINITTHGSDWLWAVFAIMLLSNIVVIVWSYLLPRGRRVFHLLPIVILTTASIAYFSMASDLGGTPVQAEFFGRMHQNGGETRAIWYVRYIDWVITTPLLLMELLLATGLPISDIFVTVFMDVVMIVAGLVGALVPSTYKWGYFAGGMVALFYIWFILLGPARTSAGLIGTDVRGVFVRSAAFLAFIWLLYPIAWGLSDGGNVITPDSEMVFYGILDLIAKPVFIFWHLFSLRGIDTGRFGLTGVGIGGISADQGMRTGAFGEKSGAGVAGAAPVNRPVDALPATTA